MLPTSFINYWKPKLGNTLRLTAYDGIIVIVQLERIDGEIYLANGWEEFFYHHNLQDGYVVVFESNENSMLNMRIFDHSRVEITYGSNYEVDDDDLNMDNPAFEVKLSLDHNNHREIIVYTKKVCKTSFAKTCAKCSNPRLFTSLLGYHRKFKRKWYLTDLDDRNTPSEKRQENVEKSIHTNSLEENPLPPANRALFKSSNDASNSNVTSDINPFAPKQKIE
ncbi:putative B3 domain-containing protein Os03g0621600 [Olea europaea var. sylvestris]|uniref:putative B3 domain-containing protein Os03g0621600 n=1 Tax=Olea europaea var. sylvestris TaxID=158386 RepID=UPI000C1D00B3|nr:putative B3 domain-containing protein Os03g0621600 [Olea europaea var. sylvestris]